MSRYPTAVPPEDGASNAEVLTSFLDELAQSAPALPLVDHSAAGTTGATGNHQQREANGTSWSVDALERKLGRVSTICVDETTGEVPPRLTYSTLNAIVRLVTRLVPLVDRSPGSSVGDDFASSGEGGQPFAIAGRLLDLALLCLANLLESPCWRHVFFRVLHEVQLEQQELTTTGSGCATTVGERPPDPIKSYRSATLQEHLWRRIVRDGPTGETRSRGKRNELAAAGAAPRASSPRCSLVTPVSRAAVRLCCNMIRHCPLSFPASCYASIAPHLADYLISSAGAPEIGGEPRNDGADGSKEADLMALLDLFASCARGSPHFRQYVKGLRRKRELFRRLLGFLSPQCSGGIVVRALRALTRILAGDPLEEKVFHRGNALETSSLVTDNLLDLSGRINHVARSWATHGGSTLGEQRQYADVASDLARSRVFMTVLLETGSLACFLREAVAVLARAATGIPGNVAGDTPGALRGRGALYSSEAASSSLSRGVTGKGWGDFRGEPTASSQRAVVTSRAEPLLRALCSFCLEHSPARTAFVRVLLSGKEGASRKEEPVMANRAGGTGAEAASLPAAPHATTPVEPFAALFALCLHPHLPTAAAASTLLQCLLVGGGALGAVSGPSPDAAAGVGVIPARYLALSAGPGAGGGIGQEDPLQSALLERIGAVALGGCRKRNGGSSVDRREDETRCLDAASSYPGDGDVKSDKHAGNPCDSSSDSEEEAEVDSSWLVFGDLRTPSGLADTDSLSEESSSSSIPRPGPRPSQSQPRQMALSMLLRRLHQIGAELAAEQEKQKLTLVEAGVLVERRKRAGFTEGSEDVGTLSSLSRGGLDGGAGLRARSIEAEQELTSILCLLSSLALASPTVARVLARALPLEATVAPILAAQRSVLAGVDPVDYPRAPVEIVLVVLTLIGQLGLALAGGHGDSTGLRRRPRRKRQHRGSLGDACYEDTEDDDEDVAEDDGRQEEEDWRRRENRARKRWRKDMAIAARLRRFLGEQAAMGEVKLCVGHAACRTESKDLARRVASLISLLQAGGGADALLVADALYAFAQSAEGREADLRSRALAAEAAAVRERSLAARREAALREAEGLVAQIEARNADELRRLSEEQDGQRQRLEEAHARAQKRWEASVRRSEETAADLERVLCTKEDALRCAGREARTKELEIASSRGDLAGERRLRAAAEVKLEEACLERDKLRRGKMEAEGFLEAVKAELEAAREESQAGSRSLEEERASAARGWAAAREAEQGLERSNARGEEAYGKLILMARGYKTLEEESRSRAAEAEAQLAAAVAEIKMAQEQAKEEERRHRTTKAVVKDGQATLHRAEQRLLKVSAEAAEAQAVAAAARAAAREATEKATSNAREVALQRDEVARLTAELERSRAICADKDVELANKCKELGQRAGIIEYINKLSSNAAAAQAVPVPGDNIASVCDSAGR